MIIKIAFDPDNLKPDDEAYPAFQAGGITLKVWALYKKHFITCQYFRENLIAMAELCERMLDIEDHDILPYTNIDEFVAYLGACGIYGTTAGPRHKEMVGWVVRYWDYFNLATQWSLSLQYKVVKEVDETLTIRGFHTAKA